MNKNKPTHMQLGFNVICRYASFAMKLSFICDYDTLYFHFSFSILDGFAYIKYCVCIEFKVQFHVALFVTQYLPLNSVHRYENIIIKYIS